MPKLPKRPDFLPKPKEIVQDIRQFIAEGRQEISDFAKSLGPTTTTPHEEEPQPTSGTACLDCARDHWLTVSGALNEAIRFAHTEGVRNPEVISRLGLALEEMNIMERKDLTSEKIVGLKGKERELALWCLNKSRALRHQVGAIKTPEDLERAAAEASSIRNNFLAQYWECDTCAKLETLKEYVEKKGHEEGKRTEGGATQEVHY